MICQQEKKFYTKENKIYKNRFIKQKKIKK